MIELVMTDKGLVPSYWQLSLCECGIRFHKQNVQQTRCRLCQDDYRKQYATERARKRRAYLKSLKSI